MTLNSNRRELPFSRIKFSLFTALIGVLIMMALTIIASVSLSKINMYEKYYTVIGYILKLIPGFFSAKILSKKLSSNLLLPIIVQTALLIIIFAIFNVMLSKNFNPSSFAWNTIAILLSEILGLFRTSKEKKNFHKF